MSFILGIDQSFTSTGIVILDKDGNVFKHSIISTDKSKDNTERALDVSRDISKFVRRYKVKKVALEGIPFMSRSNITRDLAGLQYTIINLVKLFEGITCEVYPPTMVKKFATGTGKASKDEMVASLPNDLKEEVMAIPKSKGRYDITDAYFIAKLLYTNLNEENEYA